MKRLVIRNWGIFQHYKDRNPPWIKLATDTFQNYEFSRLQDASKLLAVCIWTLAARSKDGSVPADLAWIKNQCSLGNLVTTEHLKELIDEGFIVDASNALADCKQSACLEGEGEGETEERKTSCDKSHPGFDSFWSTWQSSQRKVNRSGCLKKWQAKKLEPEAERIVAHVTTMQKTESWRTGFEPAPMTYLNQARYDDDIPEPTGRIAKIELPRTDEQWIAAGQRLGLNAKPGEFMDQFKGRVRSQLEAANG